jgi:hypothetical protein
MGASAAGPLNKCKLSCPAPKLSRFAIPQQGAVALKQEKLPFRMRALCDQVAERRASVRFSPKNRLFAAERLSEPAPQLSDSKQL